MSHTCAFWVLRIFYRDLLHSHLLHWMSLPIVSRSPSCLRVLIDLVEELAPEDKVVVPKFDLTEPSDEERGATEPVTAALLPALAGSRPRLQIWKKQRK